MYEQRSHLFREAPSPYGGGLEFLPPPPPCGKNLPLRANKLGLVYATRCMIPAGQPRFWIELPSPSVDDAEYCLLRSTASPSFVSEAGVAMAGAKTNLYQCSFFRDCSASPPLAKIV